MLDANTALLGLRIALQVRLFVPSAVQKRSKEQIDKYREAYQALLAQAINTRLETEQAEIAWGDVTTKQSFVTGTELLVAFVVAVPPAAIAGAFFRWLDKGEMERLCGSLEDTEAKVAALRRDVEALQKVPPRAIGRALEDLSDRYDTDIEGEVSVEVTEAAQQPPTEQ